MNAGRELDALVAEKVMELAVGHWGEKGTPEFEGMVAWPIKQNPMLGQFELPHYSTRIEDAWRVVEKLDLLFDYEIRRTMAGWQIGGHWWYNDGEGGFNVYAEAPTAPLAICLAALKAVGELNDRK